ncbi:hypothetical protein KC19_12G107500 [Ceratodon purpureus]|uniref:Thioredoxin domain-containing protein n=1 Tax=Ceratodon purpureus TaxID=3225 RepID=A0A8T0G9H0_CERPU|nr:hypothetical protein KC19_12G107500 [Ceratodon purpureus]
MLKIVILQIRKQRLSMLCFMFKILIAVLLNKFATYGNSVSRRFTKGHSPWSMSFIWDTCSELLDFVVSFVESMFSGRRAGPIGGGGRAAPSANDVLQAPIDFFDQVATVVTQDHGNVQFINNAEEWRIKVNEAKANGKVIVAKFFASWCGPCQKMAPVFVDFSKRFGDRLVFLKIDIEEVSVCTPHPLHAWIGIQVFGAFWLFVFICNASFHLKLAHYQVHRDGS